MLASCLAAGRLESASLQVTVKDGRGALVSDAVVYVTSEAKPARAQKREVIDQQNKQFIPYVTAVEVGTAIFFPNKDNIRHHVYSLSAAKRFELPLYSGVPAAPVLFDKEGFVTLGCNIHDWMIAYVAVLATPHFRVTGRDGRAVLNNLPAGPCEVTVWHPLLKATPRSVAQRLDLSGSDARELSFQLDLKPDFRARRDSRMPDGGYP